MKLAGHTMGTPDLNLEESMDLFKEIGMEGIEIRCASNGHLDTESFNLEDAPEIKTMAEKYGIEIACLTPYFKDFVHPGAREDTIKAMKKVIDIAEAIDCKRVRAYGGIEPPEGEEDKYDEYWEKTVTGLQTIGNYAQDKGVDICIETHTSTLTMSIKDTVKMVEEVGLDNVGILFDYAWVSYAGVEGPEEAVMKAKPYIKHVHVKDWVNDNGDTTTTLLGEGELEWPVVLKALSDINYQGYLSDEYEKYWKEYLPGPQIGMKKDVETIKKILSDFE